MERMDLDSIDLDFVEWDTQDLEIPVHSLSRKAQDRFLEVDATTVEPTELIKSFRSPRRKCCFCRYLPNVSLPVGGHGSRNS